ncbi:MAG: hypothetical protein NTZ13_03565 [Candidatus Parcubacteria bacterium]|nr:hypothetical protein [Candidatus Parcubacteria bacterium]
MHFRLGKITFISEGLWILSEERTEENKMIKEDHLEYVFDPDHVVFATGEENIKEGDIVWFSVVRPCGGCDKVDTIRKPVFSGD